MGCTVEINLKEALISFFLAEFSLVEISRGVVHLGGPCFLAMTLFTAHRESFQPLEMPADPLYI